MVETSQRCSSRRKGFEKLVNGRGLVFNRGLELTCIVANLFEVDASELESRMGAEDIDNLVLLDLKNAKRGQTPLERVIDG